MIAPTRTTPIRKKNQPVIQGEEEEEEEELTESGSQFPIVEPAVLGWDAKGEAKLRGIWGKGSRSTEERKQRNVREFQRQAAQCFHIGGMFKKAQEKADQRRETEVQVTHRWSGKRPGKKRFKQPCVACMFFTSLAKTSIDRASNISFEKS